MKCIFCNAEQLFTVNSRSTGKNQVWRRRRCGGCGKTFTTKEEVDWSHLVVIKRDGRKKKFNKIKIFCGVYNALREIKSMDRGKAAELSAGITDLVLQRLKNTKKEIESREIAGVVLEVLLEENQAGFLRYLAYVNKLKLLSEKSESDTRHWKRLIRKAVE